MRYRETLLLILVGVLFIVSLVGSGALIQGNIIFTPASASESSGIHHSSTDLIQDASSPPADIIRKSNISISAAEFSIEDFSAPSTVTQGDTILAEATIRNIGDTSGSATVTYLLMGRTFGSTTVSLDPGESDTVRLGYNSADLSPGTYTHGVSVGSDSMTKNVRIEGANSPPTADAGPDRTVTAGESVTLDGTGSSDPDGDSLSYSWSGTAHLTGTSSATPTFNAPSADSTRTYTATLSVDDGNGGSDSDSVAITVEPDNSPPIADAGPDQTVTAGESITLDGTGSSDPDGDSLSYSWNGTRYFSDTASMRPTFDAPVVETTEEYTAVLRVEDGNGASDSDSVTITVEPPSFRANDLDGDGIYEDVNGDGTLTISDADALDANLSTDWVQTNVKRFDFTADGSVDGADVCALRREAGGECQVAFEISEFSPPKSISAEGPANATTTVENTGKVNGTTIISYKLDRTAVASRNVTIAAGESATITFSIPSALEPGEYDQRVSTDDDERRATLVVEQPTTATQTPSDTTKTAVLTDRTTDTAGVDTQTTPDDNAKSVDDSFPVVPIGAGVGVILVLAGVMVSRMQRDSDREGDSATGQATSTQSGRADGSSVSTPTGTAATVDRSDRLRMPTDLSYDDFDRGGRIGSGGNADVYQATVTGPDGPVEIALKEPRISGTLTTANVEQLLSEAETWAKLDEHEHIVAVHGWGSQPLPWIAMEHMDGGNLATALPLPYERRVEVLQSTASAIEYAHRAGIAHGDLKPSNILFAGDPETGVAKVGDWGLAKVLLEHSQSTEGLSPAYAAPEQFKGGSEDIVGPQLTDVYQLGAVAYEVFTGQPPFEGTPFEVMEQVRSERPTPPTEVDPSLPAAVDEIIVTAIAKDPDDRYETMTDFRRALENL
mgnify:CR=1 FL=1